tara:strand:+ start:805 stop:978 length:174 start_codon:yes stop_codon:yes gene_type:complete
MNKHYQKSIHAGWIFMILTLAIGMGFTTFACIYNPEKETLVHKYVFLLIDEFDKTNN